MIGLGRPVSYFPSLARLVGVKECVFICQFLYWIDKTDKTAAGWVYKTQDEITEETGMSRAEQETVRRNLKRTGIVEERHARLLHRMYYRVNLDKLSEVWTNAEKSHSGELDLDIGVGGNPAPAAPVIPHSSLGAETTSENTSKKARERNLLFDALCEIDRSNPDEARKNDGGKIGKCLAKIKQMTPDVTPEEIKRRAGHYRAEWPSVTCSANALANHWARFGKANDSSPSKPNGRGFESCNIDAFREYEQRQLAARA